MRIIVVDDDLRKIRDLRAALAGDSTIELACASNLEEFESVAPALGEYDRVILDLVAFEGLRQDDLVRTGRTLVTQGHRVLFWSIQATAGEVPYGAFWARDLGRVLEWIRRPDRGPLGQMRSRNDQQEALESVKRFLYELLQTWEYRIGCPGLPQRLQALQMRRSEFEVEQHLSDDEERVHLHLFIYFSDSSDLERQHAHDGLRDILGTKLAQSAHGCLREFYASADPEEWYGLFDRFDERMEQNL